MLKDGIQHTWQIFVSPPDHPGKWVIRRFEGRGRFDVVGTSDCHICASLAEARSFVPAGAMWFTRNLNDPPYIAEIWV